MEGLVKMLESDLFLNSSQSFKGGVKLMFGGLDVALIMLSVSLCSEGRRGRGGEKREMHMDQNAEKFVLMKDNYWSSVHLSGAGWGEEIPLRAVGIEFHTETKISSPLDAARSTHEGSWLQRRRHPKALTPNRKPLTNCNYVHKLWIFIHGGSSVDCIYIITILLTLGFFLFFFCLF